MMFNDVYKCVMETGIDKIGLKFSKKNSPTPMEGEIKNNFMKKIFDVIM